MSCGSKRRAFPTRMCRPECSEYVDVALHQLLKAPVWQNVGSAGAREPHVVLLEPLARELVGTGTDRLDETQPLRARQEILAPEPRDHQHVGLAYPLLSAAPSRTSKLSMPVASARKRSRSMKTALSGTDLPGVLPLSPQDQRPIRERSRAALDRIERQRDKGRRLLLGVGASFTVADLTAASLLSPLLPPEIQYPLRVELPPDIQDYRAALLRHPAAQWALEIYRQHRGSSMEVDERLRRDFAIAEPPARPAEAAAIALAS